MCDMVQPHLEHMLPELEDLQNLSLFNNKELSSIVSRRRKFEYRLRRHCPLKRDHLDYVEHERNIHRLRNIRNARKGCEKKGKKSVSCFAGVNRIMRIQRMGTMRWKGDVELWIKRSEFCKENKNIKERNKVLAEMIRLHQKNPGVWTYAAASEFDQNPKAARAHMQRGLRSCPTSDDLWVEYLLMELTYLNKLRARKVALGEDVGTLVQNHQEVFEKQWKNENKELLTSLYEKRENDDEPNKGLDSLRKLGLSIFQTVYGNAVDAIPSSFSLRTRFFEILEATTLDHSGKMRREILSDMKRDFLKEPEYWNWLAKNEMKNTKVLDCTNSDMDRISRILAVYENAESVGCVTEDLACQQVKLYLQVGELGKAKELVEKLCTGKLSNAVNLWVLKISIETRSILEMSSSPTKANLTYIFGLLKKVISDMNVSKAESLWHMALQIFSKHKKYLDKLMDLAMTCLTRDGGNDDGFSLSSTIVELIFLRDGIHRARDKYYQFLGWKRPGVSCKLFCLPRPGLVFYKRCTEMEVNLALMGDRDGLENARRLFDCALATYGQDVNLWQDYYTMEVKMGTSKTADGVYFRAEKLLKDKVLLLSSADSG